jgi:hypothetical protein
MTTRSSAEHLGKRLVTEIEQLLDSGPVGLYEFIWILRMWPEAQDAIHSIAFDSLKKLLSRPECKLKWDKWPIQKPLRAELRRIDAIPADELWREPDNCSEFLVICSDSSLTSSESVGKQRS